LAVYQVFIFSVERRQIMRCIDAPATQGVETMRKLLLGIAAAAALSFGSLGAQPAQAQGFSVTFGTGNYGYYPPPPPRPVYRAYPVYGRPAYRRPHYPDYGPECTTRVRRYWDGFRWVSERREICG
jgi:hypothetical protein